MLSCDFATDSEKKWEALESLRTKLFGSGKAYLFVDPMMGTPWRRSEKDVDGAYRELILDLRTFELPVSLCPFVVPLQDSIGGFFDESFEHAWGQWAQPQRPYPVCAWFSTDLQESELRRSLASQITRWEDTGRWLLRFYDPRVAQHMIGFVDSGFCLEGVNGWWYIDSRGGLETLPCGDQEHQFSATAVRRLDWLRVVNQASTDWMTYAESDNVDFERLYDAVHAVSKVGLSQLQEADCIAFILHRCLIHDQIEKHPKVAAWLADASQGGSHYVDASACASTETWKEIAAGDWLFKSRSEQGVSHG